MTKQQPKEEVVKGHSIADESLDENLILHCWNGVQDQCRRVTDFNRSQGVTNPSQFIGYMYAEGTVQPMSVKQKIRWLNITKHKKTGEFRTVENLVASGNISEIEKEVFGPHKYPRIEINGMKRFKAQDGSEYLVRNMRAFGLSEIGAVLTLPLVGECDFVRKAPISPSTARLQNGTDVKVLVVGSGEDSYETSPKIYTTPFNKENVLAALEKYPPSEENGYVGKISYMFEREGVTNGVVVSGIDEFLGDFDEIWAAKTQPTPQININSKDILNYVKHDRESHIEHKQYS